MKTAMIVMALLVAPITANASLPVTYVSMPMNIGYAIDVKGARHPNTMCMKDAVYAPWLHDFRGNAPGLQYGDEIPTGTSGLYRLSIDLTTGLVTRVTIVKATGYPWLDNITTARFRTWRFKPGTWQTVILPTSVKRKWLGLHTAR
jgi:hypothetical protein